MRILESWIVVLNQWHHGSLTRGRSIRELYYAHWRAQLNAMLRAAAKEDGTQSRIDLIPAQKDGCTRRVRPGSTSKATADGAHAHNSKPPDWLMTA
jgi:hypothetical protein